MKSSWRNQRNILSPTPVYEACWLKKTCTGGLWMFNCEMSYVSRANPFGPSSLRWWYRWFGPHGEVGPILRPQPPLGPQILTRTQILIGTIKCSKKGCNFVPRWRAEAEALSHAALSSTVTWRQVHPYTHCAIALFLGTAGQDMLVSCPNPHEPLCGCSIQSLHRVVVAPW